MVSLAGLSNLARCTVAASVALPAAGATHKGRSRERICGEPTAHFTTTPPRRCLARGAYPITVLAMILTRLTHGFVYSKMDLSRDGIICLALQPLLAARLKKLAIFTVCGACATKRLAKSSSVNRRGIYS